MRYSDLLGVAMAAAVLGASVARAQQAAPAPVIEKLFAQAIPLVAADASAPAELQLKPGDRIVALGDSITAGGGYLRYIEQVLATNYPALKSPKILNAGVSGNKAESMIARFEKDVVARQPTVVTINVGINDVWHRLKAPHSDVVLHAYRTNLVAMVSRAQAVGARVILLAPTVIQENLEAEGNLRLPLYVEAMKAVAAEQKCGFVDLHAMFRQALAHKPADRTGNWLTGDGVHMAPLGNGLMALGVLRALGVPDATSADTDIIVSVPRPPKPASTNAPAARPAPVKLPEL